MLYKDIIEKYNFEVINLDIKDFVFYFNFYLQFYFSLLKDDVVKEGGGQRYFIFYYFVKNLVEKEIGGVFYIYIDIYESINSVVLQGDGD